MIKYIIILLTCTLFTGCVSIKVMTPDGTKASYFRSGDQEIEGFEFNPETGLIKFKKQSGSSDLAESLKNATGAINKALEIMAGP